jgi:hypothetical protein
LRTDDVAADDAFHEFEVEGTPEDEALIPVHQALGQLEQIRVVVAMAVDRVQADPSLGHQRQERLPEPR